MEFDVSYSLEDDQQFWDGMNGPGSDVLRPGGCLEG